MKFFINPISPSVLIVMICILTACSGKQDKNSPSKQGRQLDFTEEVTFLNESGEEISTVKVAVADEPSERNQGLMDVTNLENDEGMLFIFGEEDELSFYMANTPLPLDIIFVNSDSMIVRIHHNTTPFSDRQLPSDAPAQFVVETNGGYCVANDIREGMKVRF